MKTISNREEANNYYKIVNSAVDDFQKKTKARNSELHNYFKRNGKSFLKRLEVSDVIGIENVLNDVLLHKKHLEDDKVITFESFSKLNENTINIGSPSVEHEKVLADLFSTSLGHIEILDPQLHLFKINDFGKDVYAIILNESEISKLKEMFIGQIKEDLFSKVVSVSEIQNVSIDPLKFWLSDILDETKVMESINSKVSKDLVFNFIKESFSSVVGVNYDLESFSFFKEHSGFFIWVA